MTVPLDLLSRHIREVLAWPASQAQVEVLELLIRLGDEALAVPVLSPAEIVAKAFRDAMTFGDCSR